MHLSSSSREAGLDSTVLFARLIAVVIFLQGTGPVLLFGAWRPSGWFLLGVACIYTLLAKGLWDRRSWSLPAALILTLPQLIILNSRIFSWRFYIGTSFGMGLCPRLNILAIPVFSYHTNIGAFVNCAFFGYSSGLTAEFAGTASKFFICINGCAAVILGLLTASLIVQRHAIEKIPTPSSVL